MVEPSPRKLKRTAPRVVTTCGNSSSDFSRTGSQATSAPGDRKYSFASQTVRYTLSEKLESGSQGVFECAPRPTELRIRGRTGSARIGSDSSDMSTDSDSHSVCSSSGYSSKTSEASDLESPASDRPSETLPPKKRREARQRSVSPPTNPGPPPKKRFFYANSLKREVTQGISDGQKTSLPSSSSNTGRLEEELSLVASDEDVPLNLVCRKNKEDRTESVIGRTLCRPTVLVRPTLGETRLTPPSWISLSSHLSRSARTNVSVSSEKEGPEIEDKKSISVKSRSDRCEEQALCGVLRKCSSSSSYVGASSNSPANVNGQNPDEQESNVSNHFVIIKCVSPLSNSVTSTRSSCPPVVHPPVASLTEPETRTLRTGGANGVTSPAGDRREEEAASAAGYPSPVLPMPINPLHNIRLLSECQMAVRPDDEGDMPLHIAAVQGNIPVMLKVIPLMILAGVSIDSFNNLQQTPLHLSVITKQPAVTKLLLQHGANPALSNRLGNNCVHLAILHESMECLDIILKKCSKSILEVKNFEGLSVLHVSVVQKKPQMVAAVLDAGADIDMVEGKSGRTSLHLAAERGHTDVVELLLKRGAGVNVQCYSGSTALHLASGRGLQEVVSLLLNHGADSTLRNVYMDQAFWTHAAHQFHSEGPPQRKRKRPGGKPIVIAPVISSCSGSAPPVRSRKNITKNRNSAVKER